MNKELSLKDWNFEVNVTPDMMNAQMEIDEFLQKQSVKDTMQYITNNQDTILQLLMKVIRDDYDEAFRLYGEDEEIPEVESDEELKELIIPIAATFHDVVKDGFNYVGFGFEASWQVEHGIGVLMHKDRVVQHGGEDHAFLEYMAEDDAKLN